MRKSWAIAVAIGLLLLASCRQSARPTPTSAALGTRVDAAGGGSYRQISPAELRQLLDAGGMTLVNAHVPYEGEIEPTDLSVPYNEIASKADQLPDKAAVTVLYCKTGGMSSEAVAALAKLGYTGLYELRGGMEAWEAAGYPLKE